MKSVEEKSQTESKRNYENGYTYFPQIKVLLAKEEETGMLNYVAHILRLPGCWQLLIANVFSKTLCSLRSKVEELGELNSIFGEILLPGSIFYAKYLDASRVFPSRLSFLSLLSDIHFCY